MFRELIVKMAGFSIFEILNDEKLRDTYHFCEGLVPTHEALSLHITIPLFFLVSHGGS